MNQINIVANRAAMALVFGFSALALPQAVEAQPRWGRPIAPRSGACFYRDAGFRGQYFCARAGEEVPFLSRTMNNQISSIRVFGDAEVRIFQANRFRGRAARVEGAVWNLREEGWNDRVSSIRVRYDRNDRNDRNDRGDDYWRGGFSITLGDRSGDGRGYGRDRGGDGRGYDGRGYDRGNNDRGNRQLTQAEAEQIVAAAYRSTLNREPDPASRPWVDRVLRERLTQAELEAELRKSDEYRNKRR